MSPKIAAAIYATFMITALWLDIKRQRPGLSIAIWLPILWLMNTAARPLSYWLSPDITYASELDFHGISPINRNFNILLIVSGLLVICSEKRRSHALAVIRNNRLMIAFFVFMGLSAIWSFDFALSMKRYIKVAGTLIMGIVVLTEENEFLAVKTSLRRTGILLIPLSVLFIKYYRDIGVAYAFNGTTMWIGVTSHKNSLGQLCLVMACCFLWDFLDHRHEWRRSWTDTIRQAMDLIIVLMTLWLLNGPGVSRSTTSIVVLIVGTLSMLTICLLKNNRQAITKVLMSAVILALFINITLDVSSSVIAMTGRDASLTGRVPLWNELIQMGRSNAILGSGVGAFWTESTIERLWTLFEGQPESSHNGYINVFLEFGMVGVILLLAVLASSYKTIIKSLHENYEFGRWRLALLIIVATYNFAETSFCKPSSMLWLVFVIIGLTGTPIDERDLPASGDNKGLRLSGFCPTT